MHQSKIYLVEIGVFNPGTMEPERLYFSSGSAYITKPNEQPPNLLYEPRITSAANFERCMFSGDGFFGESKAGYGSIEVCNIDGKFDYLASYALDGRGVTIKYGNEGGNYNDFAILLKGTMGQAEFTNAYLSIHIRDMQYMLDKPIQESKFKAAKNEQLEGKVKPLCYGYVFNISPVLVDSRHLIYQFHDGQVEAVLAVYDKGVKLEHGINYDIDLAGGCITLKTSPVGDISIDAIGDKKAGQNIGDIISYILKEKAGLKSFTASFNKTITQLKQKCGIYLQEEKTINDVLNELAKSVGAYYGFDRNGAFDMGILLLPFREKAQHKIDEDNILSLEKIANKNLPYHEVRLGYRKNYTLQDASSLAGSVEEGRKNALKEEYSRIVIEDKKVKAIHPMAEALEVSTILIDEKDAKDLANKLLTLFGKQRDVFKVKLSADGALYEIGQTMLVTYKRYNLAEGRSFIITGVVEESLAGLVTLTFWG